MAKNDDKYELVSDDFIPKNTPKTEKKEEEEDESETPKRGDNWDEL